MIRKTISIIVGILLVAAVAAFGAVFRIHEVVIEYVGGGPTVVDPVQVYADCGVDTNGSILGLNENDVKKRVAELYPDRLIVVKDIVREFPNTVKIYVEEHAPLCAVSLKTGDGYVIADRDFALNRVVSLNSFDSTSVVVVKGITVGNTYDTPEFRTLREVFLALEGKGVPAAAQPELLSSITFAGDNLILETRDSVKLTVPRNPINEVGAKVAAAYDEYVAARE